MQIYTGGRGEGGREEGANSSQRVFKRLNRLFTDLMKRDTKRVSKVL